MAYTKSETTISDILGAAAALFLDKNYADVSMEDIAETAGVTKGALYHHFGHSTETIAAIAARVGFDDSAYFSRMFRKHTGQSPQSYRQMRK